MRIVIIIQARVGSSRLPAKVLMPLAGKPLLARMLERLVANTLADDVMVATTMNTEDDAIEELSHTIGVPCFRGHSTDLLDRHFRTARAHNADVVLKIPSDCPLIDPAIIDKVIGYYTQHADQYDFVSNLHPSTYPDGNDVEVIPIGILEQAWVESTKDYEREHTTPFIWEHPERFRIGNVVWETGHDYSMSHRFTIDYAEDYEFIKRVYDELWSEERPIFSLGEILKLLEEKPEIYNINAHLAGVNWYRHHLNDLRTVSQAQTKILETI